MQDEELIAAYGELVQREKDALAERLEKLAEYVEGLAPKFPAGIPQEMGQVFAHAKRLAEMLAPPKAEEPAKED